MMIKMLLEEAGQYFYCEARKTSSHDYEGIVHFLHKVGDGNAFVRGRTHHLRASYDSRNDALTAAEHYGKHIALRNAPNVEKTVEHAGFASGTRQAGRTAAGCMKGSAC